MPTISQPTIPESPPDASASHTASVPSNVEDGGEPITEETKVEEQQDPTNPSEEEKEALREKKKWDGYVPPEKRRPPDEFFDLKTL